MIIHMAWTCVRPPFQPPKVPQRPFNADELEAAGCDVTFDHASGRYIFNNKHYGKDGFLYLDTPLVDVSIDGVEPSLQELQLFQKGAKEPLNISVSSGRCVCARRHPWRGGVYYVCVCVCVCVCVQCLYSR